jgi:hypothetical protein
MTTDVKRRSYEGAGINAGLGDNRNEPDNRHNPGVAPSNFREVYSTFAEPAVRRTPLNIRIPSLDAVTPFEDESDHSDGDVNRPTDGGIETSGHIRITVARLVERYSSGNLVLSVLGLSRGRSDTA